MMINLLDGIRKLKECRQEALQRTGAVSAVTDNLAELITAYEAIGDKSTFVRGKNSTATDQDKKELERMEKSFSYRWNNLTAEKQKEFVDRLLAKGLLPDIVKQVLDKFNGTVVSFV